MSRIPRNIIDFSLISNPSVVVGTTRRDFAAGMGTTIARAPRAKKVAVRPRLTWRQADGPKRLLGEEHHESRHKFA